MCALLKTLILRANRTLLFSQEPIAVALVSFLLWSHLLCLTACSSLTAQQHNSHAACLVDCLIWSNRHCCCCILPELSTSCEWENTACRMYMFIVEHNSSLYWSVEAAGIQSLCCLADSIRWVIVCAFAYLFYARGCMQSTNIVLFVYSGLTIT